ncbi:hypothetical protein IEQ34_022529 [Dendrobium chrysotoxum]|uniref:Uncharacterized protein n=1 Tax=Dendrobium chrysotoxum TaxID=161865 RepID=A0AAV7FZ96_DENCH|nr:hypothetical protein IEQ34_022529 [Dendrobium chrysotoxum]
MKVPEKSDCICSPPLEFLTVYAFNLIKILAIYGVSLSHLSYRAISIIKGLIIFFRDRGAVLSPEYLSLMGRLVICRVVSLSDLSDWIFTLEIY